MRLCLFKANQGHVVTRFLPEITDTQPAFEVQNTQPDPEAHNTQTEMASTNKFGQ